MKSVWKNKKSIRLTLVFLNTDTLKEIISQTD